MKKNAKMKKVTVSSSWINEIFIGNETEVFNFLADIKKKQFEMLDDSLQKSYKKAHGRYGLLHNIESVRNDIHKKYPDIGLKIKIEDCDSVEKKFF